MSGQALTYEGILELFQKSREESERERKKYAQEREEYAREWREQLREQSAAFDRRMRITERIARKASKSVSKLGNRIGDIIENMVGGNTIVRKFNKLGYKIERFCRNQNFGRDLPKDMRGEIDLLLENGDIAILIEVKATLTTADVRTHIARLEKYRRVADIKGDKRRFIGAVAGAVVEGEAEEFAHENGMYVIVQTGEAVEIVPTPEGFQAKEW